MLRWWESKDLGWYAVCSAVTGAALDRAGLQRGCVTCQYEMLLTVVFILYNQITRFDLIANFILLILIADNDCKIQQFDWKGSCMIRYNYGR